jgi:hypothetical protein
VFTRSGTAWTQQQELTAADAAAGDRFGDSVALSSDGSTALIGADAKASAAGAAYVFTRSGTTWTQQRELTASADATGDDLGVSVALSGDGGIALVGAAGTTSATGAAYVFSRSGTTWTRQQRLAASDGAAGDRFGSSAALSSDGSTALIGAPTRNSSAGAVYAFTRAGTSNLVSAVSSIGTVYFIQGHRGCESRHRLMQQTLGGAVTELQVFSP